MVCHQDGKKESYSRIWKKDGVQVKFKRSCFGKGFFSSVLFGILGIILRAVSMLSKCKYAVTEPFPQPRSNVLIAYV